MRPREFPLLRRELVGLLRTKRAFWLLVSAVGVSGAVLLLSWPSFWESAPQDPSRNASRFGSFIVTQLIVTLLFTPAFTATAFTAEREERTFELVYSTLLSPFSIVFSKFLSSVGYLLLILVASAPVVSALYLLGGFGFDTILTCYAITVAALVSSSLVCLTVSLRSASTAQAMVRSFVWLLIWNGGLSLVLWLILAVLHQAGVRMADDLAVPLIALSPFSALLTAETSFMDARWPLYFGWAGLLSVAHLAYLLRKTRNPYAVFQERGGRAGPAGGRRLRARARPRRTALGRLLVSLGDGEVPGFTNPVFQKEVRSEFYSRALYRRLVFWSGVLLYTLLAIVFQSAWGSAWLHAVASLNLFLVLVLVPAVAATSVTREKEKGNLDFLRSSLLSQGAILRGKFLSSIYSNSGLVAAMVWVSVIAAVCFAATRSSASSSERTASLGVVALVVLMTLVVLTFVAALSLLASVLARRSAGALLLSYGAILFICVGVPIIFSLIDFADIDRPFGMATEPFIAINAAIEGLTRPAGSARGEVYWMLAWFTAIYGIGTAGLFWLAVRTGERRLARER